MAVGLRIKFDGGTQEQYEAVNAQMNVEEDLPEGLVFHAAVFPVHNFIKP